MATTNHLRTFKRTLTQSILTPFNKLATKMLQRNVEDGIGISLVVVGVVTGYYAYKFTSYEKDARQLDALLGPTNGLATDYIDDGAAGFGTDEELQHVRGVGAIDRTLVDVKQHRKVRSGCRLKYMNCVLSDVKNKFGTPERNVANVKAVQRYANNVMSKHGVRPTHIKRMLPMIVSMAFVPSNDEVEAVRFLNSGAATVNKVEYLVNRCISDATSC